MQRVSFCQINWGRLLFLVEKRLSEQRRQQGHYPLVSQKEIILVAKLAFGLVRLVSVSKFRDSNDLCDACDLFLGQQILKLALRILCDEQQRGVRSQDRVGKGAVWFSS